MHIFGRFFGTENLQLHVNFVLRIIPGFFIFAFMPASLKKIKDYVDS